MEYQGTKEELGVLMVGEAAGTAARFAIDFAFARFILFPIIIAILFLLGLIFGSVWAGAGIVLLVVGCVIWILWAFCSRVFARSPDQILNKFLYSLPSGSRDAYYEILWEQRESHQADIIAQHAEQIKRNPEKFREEIGPMLERRLAKTRR